MRLRSKLVRLLIITKAIDICKFNNTLENKPFTTDSIRIDGYMVIMIYSTNCFHCLNAFDQLVNLVSEKKNVSVIMISADSSEEIQNFKDKFDLDANMPINFLQTNHLNLFNVFGHFVYPTILCYDRDKKLTMRLSDEIDIKKLETIMN